MDCVKITGFKANNRSGIYDISIFQSSFDEICISIQNTIYHNPKIVQFIIPVKKEEGFSWKLNKASIGNDSGKSIDIIKLFSTYNAYAKRSIQELIFNNPKKANTVGL